MTKNSVGAFLAIVALLALLIFHPRSQVPAKLVPTGIPVQKVIVIPQPEVIVIAPKDEPKVEPPKVVRVPLPKPAPVRKPEPKKAEPAPRVMSLAERKARCTPDAFRFCSAAIPDREKIIACLKDNLPNLSTACHAVFAN